jgi:HSP20 family protein
MLARWEPFGGLRRRRDIFGELFDMQEQMNRMFDEFFGERRTGLAEGAWVPSVDVSETDAAIVVRAELPGMSQDDIELNLQDNVLTLKGEKKQETKEQKENYHRTECCFGSFSRSFSLPATVKQEDIQATFKDGVLEISLPKAEEAKAKKIAITAGS